MKKIIIFSTTLLIVAYGLFLGVFLGLKATAFTVAVWFGLMFLARIVGWPLRIALILIVTCLLVLVPVNFDFTDFAELPVTVVNAFKAAANVDYSASFIDLGPFWWVDILAKFIVFLFISALCGIAVGEKQKGKPNLES